MFTQPAPTAKGDFDLRESFAVLRRRKWSMLIVIVVVLAVAAVMSYRKTPVYESTAVVLLRSQPIDSLFSNAGSSGDPERRVQNEAELMRSAATQREVAERLGYSAGVALEAGGETDVIEVTASSTDPDEAALIANTYAEAHRDLRQQQNVEELTTAQQEVQVRLDQLATEREQVQQQLDEAVALRNTATDPTELESLADQVEQAENALSLNDSTRQPLEERRGQLQVASDLAASQAPLAVLTPAAPASSPESPDHRQDLVVGLVLGALAAVAVAFLREHLDDSIRTTDDLGAVAPELPQLGVIPEARETMEAEEQERPTIVTAARPMSHVAEAYRALRTSVEFLGLERRIHTLQITSASAGEGKTATVVNLAAAFAQAGERVAVLDCDLRRPRLHEYFGLDREVGLTSVLLDDSDPVDGLQAAPGFDTLDVLCAGPLAPNPSELLRTDRFAETVEALLADHSLLLVDSPPVLPVTDATIISRVIDATLVVASSGASSKRRVRRAVQTLRQVQAPLVGTVLNRAPMDVAYGYVDYGYAYYGNGRTEARNGRRSRRRTRAEKATKA
jgi:non-specific protein-tyrosine kinase